MNPIKITSLSLAAWTILVSITGFFTQWDDFRVPLGWFYLAPVICMVTFLVSALFYRSWIMNNRRAFDISLAILTIWLLVVTAIFVTR